MFILLVLSLPCLAEDYLTYQKIGVGYSFPQEDKFLDQEGRGIELFTGKYDAYTYTVEAGITTQGYELGISYSNIVHQQNYSKDMYNPYRLDIFIQKNFDFNQLPFTPFFGVGYLVGYDKTISYEGATTNIQEDRFRILQDITAKFGVKKRIDNWEFAIVHFSQWITGKPFDDKYENAKTEFVISYIFD
jgi:hypothetical protein